MARHQWVLTRAAGFILAGFTSSLVAGVACGQTTSTYKPNNNNSGTWHNTDRWDNAHIPNAEDDVAIFNHPIDSGFTGTGTYSLTLDGNDTTVGAILSNNANNSYHFKIANGNLIFQSASGTATYTESAYTTGAPTAPGTDINSKVTLNSDLKMTVSALGLNSQTQISGLINGTSARKFIMDGGNGNLQLSNAAALSPGDGFFGEYVINQGTIRVIQNVPISKAKAITVSNGGQIQFGNSITDFNLNTDPLVDAVLNAGGAGKQTGPLGGQNVDGAVRFTLGAGVTSNFNTRVNLTAAPTNVTVSVANTTGVFTKAVSGSGQLVKTGSGILKLTSANSYLGGTSVKAGQLLVDGASATLGSGDVSVLTAASTFLKINAGVTNAIADSATLSLAGGGTAGTADQGYLELGVNETVAGLILGGNTMAPGVYGSLASGAANPFDEFFTGSGLLTVSPSFLSADFNNSGTVDGTDLSIWQGGFGNTTGQLKGNGDANGDGGVDGSDFLIWQQQYNGAGAVAAGRVVPEPGAVALALLGATLMTTRRQK